MSWLENLRPDTPWYDVLADVNLTDNDGVALFQESGFSLYLASLYGIQSESEGLPSLNWHRVERKQWPPIGTVPADILRQLP